MDLYIDTASLSEIKEAASLGVLDGVTTNPSLIAKEATAGLTYAKRLAEICEIVRGPVSAEVISTDFAGMMRAYTERFGTAAQPNKPARSTMQVAGLVNPGWLAEIEVTAARDDRIDPVIIPTGSAR